MKKVQERQECCGQLSKYLEAPVVTACFCPSSSWPWENLLCLSSPICPTLLAGHLLAFTMLPVCKIALRVCTALWLWRCPAPGGHGLCRRTDTDPRVLGHHLCTELLAVSPTSFLWLVGFCLFLLCCECKYPPSGEQCLSIILKIVLAPRSLRNPGTCGLRFKDQSIQCCHVKEVFLMYC